MSIGAFRITKTKFIPSAFNGEGARNYGGRWNSQGTRMVYLAGSLSAATLELLVHTDDYSTIEGLYSYVPVEIPESCIEQLEESTLPVGWNSLTPLASTQILGDNWVTSMASAVLQVPSAITPREVNFLCNPAHPDFSKLVIGDSVQFQLDPRI